MKNPVVFLAFANVPESPLPLLEKESEEIQRVLTQGASQQYFQIHLDPYTTISKMADYLIEFKDRVSVFHYGGHADSDALVLRDQTANASGIATLLKAQKNLKLVFLNGCSTKAQVELLLDLNIPVVIATAQPIVDETAVHFATKFYDALGKRHSIKEAFELASGYVQAQRNQENPTNYGIKPTRDFTWSDSEEIEAGNSDFSWGLFYNDESALEWKLPAESSLKKEIIIRQAGDQYNFENSPINRQLVDTLLPGLREYSRKLDAFLIGLEEEEEIDEREATRAIIDCLPAPLGEQIRKLFSLDVQSDQLDKIGVPRLKQLVRTYNTLVEFFAASLIANLWELKLKNEAIELSDTVATLVKDYLAGGQEVAYRFNYADFIKEMTQFFKAEGFFQQYKEEIFIEELEAIGGAFESDEALNTALDFMQEMREEVRANSIDAEEIESFCVQSEEKLAYIMKVFGFVAKYKLSTVKRIVVQKSRASNVQYIHHQVKLDMITAGYKDSKRDYKQEFTEDQSVILMRPGKGLGRYLNLSPFIIDENALKNEEKSKMFFYRYFNKEKDSLNYKYAYKRDDTLEIKKQYPKVREEMDAFSKLFFGKQLKAL